MDQPRAGLFASRGISRRDLFRTAGAVGAGLALSSPLLSACANGSGGGGGSGGTSLKIGFVSPRTGATAGFGEPDGYALQQARDALKGGLKIGGKTYDVTIVDKDSQSHPPPAPPGAHDPHQPHAGRPPVTTTTA